MSSTIGKVIDLLTPKQRRQAVLLFAVMLLIGLLQVGAVTSIMPFMAVVADPRVVESNAYFSWVYEATGLTERGFLIFLGSGVLIAMIVTNVASVFGLWLKNRFVWGVNAVLSRELLSRYLHRPYLWYVRHGSAEAGKKILSDVEAFSRYLIQPLIELLSKGTTSIALIALIVLVDWQIALVASLFFGGSYGLIYVFQRRRLADIGRKRVVAQHLRFKSVQEGFGAFKETKVAQREPFFVTAYDEPTHRFGHYMVVSALVKGIPRYLLELLAFGGMVILVLYFLFTRDDFRSFAPVLSLYAFAGYRLMPALQHCFASMAYVRFNWYLLSELHRDYMGPEGPAGVKERTSPAAQANGSGGNERISLRRELRFDGVTFTYPESESPAVKCATFEIPCHSMVAFCGSTGSGKTSIVDLILGLFSPQEGRILVDDVLLTPERLPNWRRNVGYVPQHIFLCDDTITRNIAFGLPDDEIDMEAVVRAAKSAQIHGFVSSDLPNGYDTVVGERGVRLSGGQRQRLGIARALYHNPDVLILDEATSALDEATESRVMQAIQEAAGEKTVILIAHRLRTVEVCDRIFVIEEGKVIEQGLYRDLVDLNGSFTSMVNSR